MNATALDIWILHFIDFWILMFNVYPLPVPTTHYQVMSIILHVHCVMFIMRATLLNSTTTCASIIVTCMCP